MLADAVPSLAQAPANAVPNLQPITLPKPQKDGGKSVLAALWQRKTNRNISPEKLPPQVLSNLLWAAWGVNREGGPFGQIGRTAASASNSQEIDLYVAMAEGIRRRFPLVEYVQDHEHRGMHDGQEAGFVCVQCHDAIMGLHPSQVKEGTAVYR